MRFRYKEFIEPYKSKFGGDLIWFRTVTHGAARESRLTVAKFIMFVHIGKIKTWLSFIILVFSHYKLNISVDIRIK